MAYRPLQIGDEVTVCDDLTVERTADDEYRIETVLGENYVSPEEIDALGELAGCDL